MQAAQSKPARGWRPVGDSCLDVVHGMEMWGFPLGCSGNEALAALIEAAHTTLKMKAPLEAPVSMHLYQPAGRRWEWEQCNDVNYNSHPRMLTEIWDGRWGCDSSINHDIADRNLTKLRGCGLQNKKKISTSSKKKIIEGEAFSTIFRPSTFSFNSLITPTPIYM